MLLSLPPRVPTILPSLGTTTRYVSNWGGRREGEASLDAEAQEMWVTNKEVLQKQQQQRY